MYSMAKNWPVLSINFNFKTNISFFILSNWGNGIIQSYHVFIANTILSLDIDSNCSDNSALSLSLRFSCMNSTSKLFLHNGSQGNGVMLINFFDYDCVIY